MIIEKAKIVVKFILLCVVVFLVFRGLDYVIPDVPIKHIICIEDYSGKHRCDEYKE